MPVLKTFIYSLRQSIFNLKYYSDVLKAPFGFSVKFFLAFCLIFGLISSFTASLVITPEVKNFSLKVQDKAYELFPQELEIMVKDKKISINQEVPYFIPINYKEWFNVEVPDSTISNLVVIDTQSTNPTKDIQQYQTIALLTEDTLALRGDSNEIRVVPLEQMEPVDVVINYELYKGILDKVTPYLSYLPVVLIGAITLFFIIFLPASKIVHIFFFSILTMLISKLMKPSLTYRQALQINLHAFIVPVFVVQLITLFAAPPIPFFYSLVFLVFFLLILSKLENNRPKK